MNTQQLSLDQLVDVVKNLEEADKIQISGNSIEDFNLSAEGLKELLKRKAAFEEGKLSARPWNDIKKDFGAI